MMLLREWVRIILEGYKEDQEILIKKFPGSQTEIQQMNPKMINWFIRRFGNSPSVKEIHPFEDCIPTVQKYEKKAVGLGQKYGTNEYFRSLVDRRFPKKIWSNLSDYTNMTIDQMEEIMGLSERKKPRFEIESNEPDRSDFLGKFGPWNLWMPTTRENSTKIAGYDPETLEPKTNWCTARVTDSNLFYNYVEKGIILYYIIKDDPEYDIDWLSVGFIDGEPVLEGEDGGVSVDCYNGGLTEETLKSILGGYYQQLMTAMQEKTEEISGEHPAKKKIEEATQNLSAYQNLIKGLGKEEREYLEQKIVEKENIAPEVLEHLSNSDQLQIVKFVAINPNTPAHILEKLGNSYYFPVRENVAGNPNTPAHTLEKLANDTWHKTIVNVAGNPNTPAHTLEKLSDDKHKYIRRNIAGNPNTPDHILEKLIDNDDDLGDIGFAIACNPNAPAHILEKLSNGHKLSIKVMISCNPNTPANVLEKFSNIDYFEIKENVAHHLNTPPHVLEKLANDIWGTTRKNVAGNPNTPVHILEKFATGRDYGTGQSVAAINNPNIPIHILEKLANDKDFFLKDIAKTALNKRNKQQLTELRKLIQRFI